MKPAKRSTRKPERSPRRRTNDALLDRITIDPKILVGKPIIRGMRISVEQILNLLGQGLTHESILQEYPVLEEDDIKASLLYARDLISVEKVYKVESTVSIRRTRKSIE